jgi:hypothetical protein
MIFNSHSELIGLHAFLSPSKYHWINYDDDKLVQTFLRHKEAERGTRLHDIAAQLIRERIKLQASRKTLNMYVNDAIGYRMTPEQPLVYSANCFGTTDAISFRRNPKSGNNLLRIHDLKNGLAPTSMHQLEAYAAMFCLEYHIPPGEIEIELRIYQNDEIEELVPELEDIVHIMDRIVAFDRKIDQVRMEAIRD